MKLLERIIEYVNIEGEEPAPLGLLHALFILGVAALCLLLFLRFRDANDKTFRVLIGVMFGIILVGEIAKQIFLNVSVEDGKVIFDYGWHQFPFQLCSTPIYVLPFLSFLPDCRLRDFAASYTMTFALIGGISVYLTPKSVFTARVFTNVQSMVHHGLQIVSGIYTAIYYRRRIRYRFYFDGAAVFAVMFAIANVLNTVGYDMLVANGLMPAGDSFNMFYISPRADQTVPVASDLLKALPPVVYIIGYFTVLCLLAAAVSAFAGCVYKHSKKLREKRFTAI